MNNSQTLPHGYRLQGKENEYIIDHALGQGAFGITYLAKCRTKFSGQMGSGAAWIQVCIKEFFMRELSSREESTGSLHEATGNSLVSRYRKAFLREANNLARMQHPNIVNVFEVIEANNTAYIVMEYIDGGNLDDYIARKGHLSEDEALRLFQPICDAMNYMHAQRMLHLDLKPKNVMLDEEGKPYLIDFGLSKQYTQDGEPESSTSIGLGTPGYAPSEQAEQRDGDNTFRATIDVYALGGMLYKMLTGETPPKATEISEAVLDGTNLILEKLKEAGVSQQTSFIISKAMYPSSRKRYQSVTELMEAFGQSSSNVVLSDAKKRTKENEDTIGITEEKNDETIVLRNDEGSEFEKERLISEAKKGNPDAQNTVGCLFYYGDGFPQDNDEAIKWFKLAAEQGHADAQNNLGLCFYNGEGVEQDYKEAVKWYRLAAEQGHADAQNNLGLCYYNGEGLEKNFEQAVKWYRLAAEQDNVYAQQNLGNCYYYGEGIPKNNDEAIAWLRKSVEQGNTDALYILEQCYKENTSKSNNNISESDDSKQIPPKQHLPKWLLPTLVGVMGLIIAFLSLRSCGKDEPSRPEPAPVVELNIPEEPTETAPTSVADEIKYGSLKVTSEPSGAAIYLDGKLLAGKTTPELLEILPLGSHKIRLVSEGYEEQTKTVTIKEGRNADLSVTLKPKSASLPTQQPAQQSQQSAQANVLTHNGHEYVDLGLSVMWATCNVGASFPSAYGNYYAWGETTTKSDYNMETLKYCTCSDSDNLKFSKYVTNSKYGTIDNKKKLDSSDDVARQSWGGSWHMPTNAEWTELRNKCTWTWTTQGGHNGYKVTSKSNGSTIFLPAAGYRSEMDLHFEGSDGFYWSSSLLESVPDSAWDQSFASWGAGAATFLRHCGLTVRPVCRP